MLNERLAWRWKGERRRLYLGYLHAVKGASKLVLWHILDDFCNSPVGIDEEEAIGDILDFFDRHGVDKGPVEDF